MHFLRMAMLRVSRRLTRGLRAFSLDAATRREHEQACALDHPTYVDPKTGYVVITERMHRKRGSCCGNACRHCPFGHINVADAAMQSQRITEPCLFRSKNSRTLQKKLKCRDQSQVAAEAPSRDVLFWSGGKDSWLALDTLMQSKYDAKQELNFNPMIDPVLLTTFDASSGDIPHQGFGYDDVIEQASQLGLDLLLVPIDQRSNNEAYVSSVGAALADTDLIGMHVRRLVFGDLHLEEVKRWREEQFGKLSVNGLGYACYWPLFGVPQDKLLQRLWLGVAQGRLHSIRITSVPSAAAVRDCIQEGDMYDAETIERLQQLQLGGIACDPMGEGGEFHTQVVLQTPIPV